MKRAKKEEMAIEQEVLKILSMNARASFNFIGNRIGTSAQHAFRIVKKLEKKYGITYLAEIDVEKLGYIKFMVLARFFGNMPTEGEIKDIFDRDPRIQMAMVLTGRSYNLLFYVLVQNNEEINEIRKELTSNAALKRYRMILYLTPFFETYNFVPLRWEFVESLKGRVLARKTVRNYPIVKEKQQAMLEREFAILKEWNLDGSIDFHSIDRKYGFDKGRSQYAYYRLLQSGLIKRLTITMNKLPIRYISMFSIRIFDYDRFYSTRKGLLSDIISEPATPANKYVLAGDIGSPFGATIFLPVFTEEDAMTNANVLSKGKGAIVTAHTVTKVFGRLCFRRFDNAYTIQAETLAKRYGSQRMEKSEYFQKERLRGSAIATEHHVTTLQ